MKNIELVPTFIEIKSGMSVNIKDIKAIITPDMRRFYVIIESSNCIKERYDITKDTYFFLKKLGIGNGTKKKNKKK